MTNETDELQRVIFELPPSDWHAYGTEGIWARRITYDTYRLDNIPFFVDDVSVNDVVRVIPSDEQLLVAEVVARGGHSTCRIALQADWEDVRDSFRSAWEPLRAMGCGFERGLGRYLVADAPPSAKLAEVERALDAGQAAGVWNWRIAHRAS